ncbi:hypothetical protein JCM14635_03220 [Megalodesulfovibrio paquesii]
MLLHGLSLALLENESPHAGLEQTLHLLEQRFHPNVLVLYTVREQGLDIRMLRQQGVSLGKDIDEKHALGECLCGWAAEHREALVVHEIAKDPRCVRSECKMAGIRSLAALPLQAGGRILGLLTLGSLEPAAYVEAQALLQSAASIIALGLRNALLAEESARRLEEQRAAEAASHRNEELFRTIVENIPVIIGVFSPEGQPRYWNRVSERLLGVSLERVQGVPNPIAAIFPEEAQQAAVWEHFHAATGEFKDFAVRLEGDTLRQHRWANFRLADGTVVGIGLDVTEEVADQHAREQAREQARRELEETVAERTKALQEVVLHLHEQILANDISQQELHKQASLLHHIISTIPYCVFWKDEQLNFLGCNMRFASLAGLSSPEEIVGKSDFDMPWSQSHAYQFRAADAEILASGEPRLHLLEQLEMNGQSLVLETSKTPLRNATGEVIGVLGIFADITDRVPLEEQLRASEEKYRFLYSTMPDAFIAHDLRGRFVEWNPAFARLVGYDDRELQRLGCHDLTPLQWQSMEREIVRNTVLGQGLPAIYQKEYRAKDGRLVPVELHTFPRKGERGELAGTSAVVRDISRQKQMEQSILEAKRKAEEASQAKTEFMARMSHEIRTPMNAILGVAQLADGASSLERCRESLDIVREAAEGLMVVLNDILDISRMESLGVSFSPQPTDVARLARSLVASLEHQATARRLVLSLAFAPAEPPVLLVDPDRLRQVLFNLLHNALKFTQQGGVALSVRHVSLDDEEVELTCIVEDTGIGIPEDKLAHIFDPFYQVDGGPARRFGGSGLGLAICRQLVEYMGGTLQAVSTAGRGSRFSMTLRLPRSNEQPATFAPPEEGHALDGVLDDARVLLVEDNPLNLRVTASLLRQLGCRVSEAASGLQALQLASLHPFDVVLMDIEMPGLDGFQTHARLKAGESGEQAAHTPVVALTAHANAAFREHCLRRGMADHVSKPVALQALRRALIKALAQSRPSPQAAEADSPAPAPDHEAFSPQAPATPAGGVSLPLLDSTAALHRLGDDAVLLHETMAALRQELPDRLDLLQTTLNARQLQELHRQAHTVKGMLATVGAVQAAAVADQLSQAARQGRLGDCAAILRQLRQGIGPLLPALDQAAGISPTHD